MVVLEDGYHLVCVDNDKEIVARDVVDFLGGASASEGAPRRDPGMTTAATLALAGAVATDLSQGDWATLATRGGDETTWLQPGTNRTSGAFRGRQGLERLRARAGEIDFGAFGTPVPNADLVTVPATLRVGGFASPGALVLGLQRGRLTETYWFPDDLDAEDRHFGGAPEPVGPDPATVAFEAAVARSKRLRETPDEADLLRLYALYKQATTGDADGPRPGLLDVVGRAKFDAWAGRRGMTREAAMREYVAVVERLHGSAPAVVA